jgi:hypothetical protein
MSLTGVCEAGQLSLGSKNESTLRQRDGAAKVMSWMGALSSVFTLWCGALCLTCTLTTTDRHCDHND